MSSALDGARTFDDLSDRERQVLQMAASGMLDKQIGKELGLSLNTLRTYWTRIRTKVGDAPRTALVGAFVAEDLRSVETADLDLLPHEGVIIDVEKCTMLAADSVNDMHGLGRGVPHPLADYSHIYHPDDRELARKMIYDVIEGRVESAHVIFRLVPESGVEVINVTMHGVKGPDGMVKKVYGYRVRARDCRPDHDPIVRVGTWERWYGEEEFELDGEICAILGLQGRGPFTREDVLRITHPEDRAELSTYVQRAVESGLDRVQKDFRIFHGDGSVFWLRSKAHIFRYEDGRIRIVGTAAVFR